MCRHGSIAKKHIVDFKVKVKVIHRGRVCRTNLLLPFHIYLEKMNLKDFVVVTGMPGVQRVVSTKSNGMLVGDLDSGKIRFASVRKHQFSPLETISMYTDDDDSVELKVVFQNMLDQMEENPIPSVKISSKELRAYFTKILPNHDRDMVHTSDIKKAIRWFNFLHDRNLLLTSSTEGSDEEE